MLAKNDIYSVSIKAYINCEYYKLLIKCIKRSQFYCKKNNNKLIFNKMIEKY